MPVTVRSKTRVRGFAVQLPFRSVVQFVALLLLASSGTVLRAQTIRIKLVNGKSGRPIANTCVNTWVGTERRDAMAIPTDKDGVAWLHVTDKDAEVKTQSQPKSCGDFAVVHPVVKYADTIRVVAGYAVCQPHAPDYSWLATMEFSTKQIVQQGIVTANACGKSTASPNPGELVIFVRPLTWWEKLKE
jgi:hypothetical protein